MPKKNRNMKTKGRKNNLESGFDDMMNVALEYEFLKRQKKHIPSELRERLEKAFNWLNDLSDKEYSRLIG